jgi:hypothetical protein
MRCHRHARASALTSVPSSCGFEVGAISLRQGDNALAAAAALETQAV